MWHEDYNYLSRFSLVVITKPIGIKLIGEELSLEGYIGKALSFH
jgi:hypothetical protein